MNKKILYTASTEIHLKHFHLPYIEALQNLGWEVQAKPLPVSKSFFSPQNLRAIFSTRGMILQEGFDVISTHTTLASIIVRLSVLLISPRKRPLVFVTVHGYLFYDDRSLKKWVYLLPEMLCGRVTDVLMTMNHEDLAIARKYRLCKELKKIYYINGMGIDLSRIQPVDSTEAQREVFGIEPDDFVFIYAAEFSKRKNHHLLLKGFTNALGQLQQEAEERGLAKPEIKLILAGNGSLLEEMKGLAKELGISGQVLFPGYITNIQELYACCQAAVTTSKIEGLPFHVMEALYCKLPVIASDIKGHQELISHRENGLLFKSGNETQLADQLIEFFKNNEIRDKCKAMTAEKMKTFSIESVLPTIMKIYRENIAPTEESKHDNE